MIAAVTIGATSTLVLPPNRYRQRITFVNNSDEDMSLAPGPAAVMGHGVILVAKGGSASDKPDRDGYIYKGPWMGICASGGKVIGVTELSRGS